jgi:quinol monooxygenase YgiN
VLMVAGEMTLSAAGVAALKLIWASHQKATEAELGCTRFSLGVADEENGIVTVLEMWRSEKDLLDHHQQAHTARFLELVGPHILSMDLQIYECEAGRPLPSLPSLDHLQD